MATLTQASDQAQKDAGKIVKFGLGQIGNPTPKWATNANRWFIALITFYGFAVVSTHAQIIPQHFQDVANTWLLLAPGVTTALKNVFGWDFKNS